MKTILNLTQHPSTPSQKNEGVFDLDETDFQKLKELLTFETIPKENENNERAKKITEIAKQYKIKKAMIGGALWLICPLITILKENNIEPMFSFSKRETKEIKKDNASDVVEKVSIFEHKGFVHSN